MPVHLDIDALDEDGRGVGTLPSGRRLHVIGALPGERCAAEVEHESPHRNDAWGTLVALERSAPERVAPACPNHGVCGGCSLQHFAYPAQLAWKRVQVASALGREVAACVPSPSEIHYRNKAKLVAGSSPLVLGSYAPASHRVVDMRGCQVPEQPIEPVAERLRPALAGIPVYDEATRSGELRHVVLRASDEGKVLVVLVTRTATVRDALRDATAGLGVAGVVHDVNPTTGGGLYGGDWVTLHGDAVLPDRVGPVTLLLSPLAFFQVNRAQAAALYAAAARAAGTGRVVDLYCGAGGIALTCAHAGARVAGVESHAGAIADARASADAIGVAASFFTGDARAGLPAAIDALGGVDTIVVDPPRKGLGAETVRALVAAGAPRIVYVSCAARSLARDLAALEGAGYRADVPVPYDLMPGTPHVEVLVTLTRA